METKYFVIRPVSIMNGDELVDLTVGQEILPSFFKNPDQFNTLNQLGFFSTSSTQPQSAPPQADVVFSLKTGERQEQPKLTNIITSQTPIAESNTAQTNKNPRRGRSK